MSDSSEAIKSDSDVMWYVASPPRYASFKIVLRRGFVSVLKRCSSSVWEAERQRDGRTERSERSEVTVLISVWVEKY